MADLVSSDTCPVCLKEFGDSEIAKLPCSHVFCLLCIREWSKNMNTCPVDRQKFNCIKMYLHVNGKYNGEMTVEDKNMSELLAEDDNAVCQVCHSMDDEGLLLLCDGCDRGYHTYCLTPPLPVVPDGSWYCTRCLPIVTSIGYLSEDDSVVSSSHGISDSSDDNDIIVSLHSLQRRSHRISSSNDDTDYSIDPPQSSSLPGSSISSQEDVSSYVSAETDSDSCAVSQQSSVASSNVVTDSNYSGGNSSPYKATIASRVRLSHSQKPDVTVDVQDNYFIPFVTRSNHSNCKGDVVPEQSHGNNIKRRLRSSSTTHNGHRLHIGRNTGRSNVRCILSISDSEQSDDADYTPSASSADATCSSHAHNNLYQLKCSNKRTHKPQGGCPVVRKPRRAKRYRKGKKCKNKRRRLLNQSVNLPAAATPTHVAMTTRRARTAATSPRILETPIRQLVRARCQVNSLEEARRMSTSKSGCHRQLLVTQNDIIAQQVRESSHHSVCWDRKVIDCYKSNSSVRCSPLRNAISRHPSISSVSLKYLKDKSSLKEKPESKTTSDMIGDIFVGMDTLYNKDAIVLRSGKIIASNIHK